LFFFLILRLFEFRDCLPTSLAVLAEERFHCREHRGGNSAATSGIYTDASNHPAYHRELFEAIALSTKYNVGGNSEE
jgi:hypothetical protein